VIFIAPALSSTKIDTSKECVLKKSPISVPPLARDFSATDQRKAPKALTVLEELPKGPTQLDKGI
jgi:hypothetical protein